MTTRIAVIIRDRNTIDLRLLADRESLSKQRIFVNDTEFWRITPDADPHRYAGISWHGIIVVDPPYDKLWNYLNASVRRCDWKEENNAIHKGV